MIQSVLLRFEGVVAHVAPTLQDYIVSIAGGAQVDLDAAVSAFDPGRGNWEGTFSDILEAAGCDVASVTEVASRAASALRRPEAWLMFEDTPLGLNWMRERQVPVTLVTDWPTDMHAVCMRHHVQPLDAILREGALTDVIWHETSRRGISASEILYVGADLASDYESARSAGCHALVMDRANQFDETIPNINHLVEIELHI